MDAISGMNAPESGILDLGGDKLHEECGVFGVFNHPDAAALTALGLHALQHRGQEAAGIVTFDGEQFHSEKRLGLVGDHFNKKSVIERLPGTAAVGHVRYATVGETALRNVQPLFADLDTGGLALAHNGNLTNALSLRRELVSSGAIFQSTSDTEVIVHLIARSAERKRGFTMRLIDALMRLEGAYALGLLTVKKLIGIRDPLGIRPLVIGKLGDATILASETCALDIIGARFVREVENGEIVVISEDGIESLKPFPPCPARPCIFEYIYFARPDSIMGGRCVYDVRKALGRELAIESPANADVVIPVPDSGRAGRAWLCDPVQPAVRAWHHPQPLCRPDLHRAGAAHPQARCEAEAQSDAKRTNCGQAYRADRRQHRARHHLDQDRQHDARAWGA